MVVSKEVFVEKFSDKLVYQYLVEIGSLKTAEEFKKERKDCTVYPIDFGGEMTISYVLKSKYDILCSPSCRAAPKK